MTATSTPTLDMLPNMRDVAATIAKDARESLPGGDVVSIGPAFAELASGGMQYSVVVIVPERGRGRAARPAPSNRALYGNKTYSKIHL